MSAKTEEGKIIRKTINLLIANGWVKNKMDSGDGRHCLIGALSSVQPPEHGDDIYWLLRTFLDKKVPRPYIYATEWNDAPERNFEEVIQLLEEAYLDVEQ